MNQNHVLKPSEVRILVVDLDQNGPNNEYLDESLAKMGFVKCRRLTIDPNAGANNCSQKIREEIQNYAADFEMILCIVLSNIQAENVFTRGVQDNDSNTIQDPFLRNENFADKSKVFFYHIHDTSSLEHDGEPWADENQRPVVLPDIICQMKFKCSQPGVSPVLKKFFEQLQTGELSLEAVFASLWDADNIDPETDVPLVHTRNGALPYIIEIEN